SYRFNGVLRELSRIDLALAMREVATLPGRGRYPGRFSIVDAASEDGRLDAVLQAAMQLDEPEEKEAWLQGIFHRWGATETDAPMAAMRSIEDPVLAQKAMAGFMAGWSEQDPRGAIEFALDHLQDPLVENSLATVFGNTVHSMPGAEIQAVLDTVRERGALATIAPKMVMPLATFQPELAAELALEVPDARQRSQLISNTVVQWAHNDFPAAAE